MTTDEDSPITEIVFAFLVSVAIVAALVSAVVYILR